MAHHATELFAQCVYSVELSYDELLEREGLLKAAFMGALEQNGGEFIHFEEMGDTMRVQCVFFQYGERLFHVLCDTLAPYMDGSVEARLLFVDKDLNCLHIYTLSGGGWRECAVHLPPPGPITDALRRMDPKSAAQG